MQPTTICTPDINGVMRNWVIWEIPTSRPPPPDDEYIPQWHHSTAHPMNVAFLAKVLFNVKEVMVCFHHSLSIFELTAVLLKGSMYTPVKIVEAATAYLKTLVGNYRAQTTELGREYRSCKHTRD